MLALFVVDTSLAYNVMLLPMVDFSLFYDTEQLWE